MTPLHPASPDAVATASPPAAPAAGMPSQRPAPTGLSVSPVLAASLAAQRALASAKLDDHDAVVWLSEHIAAPDRVIYPAAVRTCSAGTGTGAAGTHAGPGRGRPTGSTRV